MAIHLTTGQIRHERRVRLFFDVSLAAGAFTSTSFYSCTNLDGSGVEPGVAAALVVTGSPACVELQLDADLTDGSLYRFGAASVPGVDATTTDPSSTVDVAMGVSTAPVRQAAAGVTDIDAAIYGVDILFDGVEFAEAPDADLATIAGPANLRAALERRALSDGLPWDGTYGLKPREYVDGTPGGFASIRAAAESQMRQDDRVAAASAVVSLDSSTPTDGFGTGYVDITVTPVGSADTLAPIRLPAKQF